QIEVTFDIDANGILNVSAKDNATGKQQSIRIEASSGLSDEEIKKMKAEAEANADADKKLKEEADKINAADAMIFQTEKQFKELGDKLTADKKAPIDAALTELKAAHESKNIAQIDAAMEKINAAWSTVSQDLYNQPGANPQQEQQTNSQDNSSNTSNQDGEVTDADFEEVK
ncbi:MAG TPA: molecular chaperone DnaK, partial [Bacteroidales bacterium]|nr:molecular chaperone DnaK [Bacteroidales bacterium]